MTSFRRRRFARPWRRGRSGASTSPGRSPERRATRSRRWAAVDRMRSARVSVSPRGSAPTVNEEARGPIAELAASDAEPRRDAATVPLAHAVRDGQITLDDLVRRDDLAEFGEEAIE